MIKQLLKVGRLLPVLLLCLSVSAWAQERKVSGKITSSDDGLGIPGVNIVEKGTTNGSVSDADGNYSLSVSANATLVISAIGFATQEVVVGEQSVINVTLATDVTSLSEIVVVGYGSQDKKEITGSVVSVTSEQFNKGNVNSSTMLLQGKVPGLSIYNKGGDPNSSPVIRLRGISTVGANVEPLIVIDGVLGASLDNVDPSDIESVTVLKDGSAAAIYGSRASSGVILVTTKKGSKKSVSLTYNGYVSAASTFKQVSNMSASQYVAAGGNDLGSKTDWQKEVTRTAISNVHNIGISGGNDNTQFRVSANFRNVQGILLKSGFDQSNVRAGLTHSALNNKLKLDFNMAFTNRESDFSFNEAMRYATLYNPTAPVKFDNGQYYQAILFDNFNPVAIINQNVNEGKRKNLNYSLKLDYALTKQLTVTANYGRQFNNDFKGEYYSRTSLFRGLNRGGLARRSTDDNNFTLAEFYGTYSTSLSKINLDLTGGYSFQQDQSEGTFIELGNFPNDLLGYNALQNSGDRISGLAANTNISAYRSPKNQIVAQFARLSLTYDNAIFFNASVRREGSTKLGVDNRYGVFPAVGAGVDLNKYFNVAKVLKVRVGYGVTGSLPGAAGQSQDAWGYNFSGGGTVVKTLDGNPNLKWEQKAETNLGVDFGFGKISGTLDVYNRNIKDFISLINVPTNVFISGKQYQNAGSLNTKGIELALRYDALQFGELKWTPGINLTSYKSVLTDYLPGVKQAALAYVGAPGQSGVTMVRVAVDEKIGQIWGPVFDGVESNGAVRYKDISGNGVIQANNSDALVKGADFKKLGNGIPSIELGWTNQLTFKNWDMNAFFRGAFGHSLANQFRAFYEPIDPGAINSYNRIVTDKAVKGLTEAKWSSLYVERADFIKLDNLSLGYNLGFTNSNAFKSVRLYLTGQNLFQITKYTGIDPDPVLQDYGAVDNGGFVGTVPDVLSPGIDRRNNYFTARTYTFGVTVNFK
jgi:TonB-dependent starch-binding outer membrane protein SusC